MKQIEDDKTLDFIGGGDDTPEHATKTKYVFWIEVGDMEVEWRPLTKTQAVRMHKCTQRTTPDGVTRYGWEVID